MEERSYDVIVLGGGPGGYPCAIRLGQLGLTVACVEGEEYGGVCLNWGCIPSKALISTAHQFEKAGKAAEQGIQFGSLSLDVGKLQGWKNGIVKKLTGGVRHLLKQNGAEAVEGMGRFVDRQTLEVTRSSGEKLRLRATRGIVVATGSATIQIPGFEIDGTRIVGAREAVSLPAVPPRLAVIGGGVIGLELGMVYQAFGSKLTVIELTDQLLPGVDPDAVKVVERSITKKGGRVLKSAKAERWEAAADGGTSVIVSVGGATERVEADVVLVAVGMRPRSRGIGLEEVGVTVDARGFVPTDERCQTNVPGVYAVGDVSGPPMLAHKATKEGEICAEVLAGKPSAKDWATIPGIVFTDPEIATVGDTEERLREKGVAFKVGRFPFAALGRAMSIRETDGFVKVIAEQASGRVLGIHIVGPSASDLISEAALALEMVATAEDIALTVHPHPTLGEALMEAAAHALGHAIHITNR
jgi:dihydrolipoamide dehydrogenase